MSRNYINFHKSSIIWQVIDRRAGDFFLDHKHFFCRAFAASGVCFTSLVWSIKYHRCLLDLRAGIMFKPWPISSSFCEGIANSYSVGIPIFLSWKFRILWNPVGKSCPQTFADLLKSTAANVLCSLIQASLLTGWW